MEEFLKLQRLELLRQGVQDLDSDEWDVEQQQQPGDEMAFMDEQENDDLDEADLAFITSILESFSQSESRTKRSHHDPLYANVPPEGTLMQNDAKQ
jgi:hypothetical protein